MERRQVFVGRASPSNSRTSASLGLSRFRGEKEQRRGSQCCSYARKEIEAVCAGGAGAAYSYCLAHLQSTGAGGQHPVEQSVEPHPLVSAQLRAAKVKFSARVLGHPPRGIRSEAVGRRSRARQRGSARGSGTPNQEKR